MTARRHAPAGSSYVRAVPLVALVRVASEFYRPSAWVAGVDSSEPSASNTEPMYVVHVGEDHITYSSEAPR